jgi:hypothetical protein
MASLETEFSVMLLVKATIELAPLGANLGSEPCSLNVAWSVYEAYRGRTPFQSPRGDVVLTLRGILMARRARVATGAPKYDMSGTLTCLFRKMTICSSTS